MSGEFKGLQQGCAIHFERINNKNETTVMGCIIYIFFDAYYGMCKNTIKTLFFG